MSSIISLKELPAELLPACNHPVAAILAILCRYKCSDAAIDSIFKTLAKGKLV